ncbi:primosomal protein N' [Slackia equolifaciens]|uniref:Replication restart protein PriA n=1 Tax=Slackia equolifaciens TaxID=498718 RepID=A0A3N0B246_9ACTN|nr:primosomal protein N' [Slackia equolifaciens]RNL41038.1 primosomal protein N' [Slackia equolifaciens]
MKIASVILDIQTQSLDTPYTYAVPDDMDGAQVGCAVLVEFGRRRAVGYIIAIAEAQEESHDAPVSPAVRSVAFHDESEALPATRTDRRVELKPLLSVLSAPYFDEFGARLIQFIAHEYIAPLSSCVHLLTPVGRAPKVVKRGDEWELQKPAKRRKKKDAEAAPILDDADIARTAQQREAFDLTEGQMQAIQAIEGAMAHAAGGCVVVDGVTGSGKTEVYLRAIRAALERGMGAIVLVPEIALTPQTVSRFESRFGDTVAVMHSRMTGGERYDQWQDVASGRKRVVVGARSALFCPMERLGLVVIDEEHESTYKQESAPRYHARDVAAWMVCELGATLVLGSATPSIETLCRTTYDPSWHRVSLPGRANGKPMPPVRIIDMAREFGSGSRSMFSRTLQEELFAALDAGHKAVLMLNQRGFANFLLCRECGYVPECPTCSVSLTYHERGNMLVCHHCGHRVPAPPVCPACGSPYLKKFGAGTQRVEAELLKLLEGREQVRVIRMDSDTTSSRDAHERLLREFAKPGAAVLLGTQMIAKGLDFDEVVLVGVINADTQLRLPDFRSAERTFDLVEQVAGRAGRGELDGQVLVQTYMADSVAIQAAATYNRKRFLSDELPKRRMLGYPPYMRLANILVWGENADEVRDVALELDARVNEAIRDIVGTDWMSLGAAPCAIERLRSQYRWHILIKAPRDADIARLVEPVIRKRRTHKRVNVACDVDPFSLL